MGKSKTRAKPLGIGTNLVSFRLSPVLLKQLDELAVRNEESRGDCAKRLVVGAINQSWLEQIDERLKDSDNRVAKLREDLATTLALMLVTFANQDSEKVEAWIREHLLQ